MKILLRVDTNGVEDLNVSKFNYWSYWYAEASYWGTESYFCASRYGSRVHASSSSFVLTFLCVLAGAIISCSWYDDVAVAANACSRSSFVMLDGIFSRLGF